MLEMQTIKEESFSAGSAAASKSVTSTPAGGQATIQNAKAPKSVRLDLPGEETAIVPNKDPNTADINKSDVTKGDSSGIAETNVDSGKAPDTVTGTAKQRAIRKILESRKSESKLQTDQQAQEKTGSNPETEADMNKQGLSNTILAATAMKALGRQNSNVSTTPSLTSSLSSSVGLAERMRRLKRVPKSTADLSSLEEDSERERRKRKKELDAETYVHLFEPLKDCSRQRLRAILMGLRRFATVESRVTAKELKTVLEENQVKVAGRSLQMLVEAFEDSFGIDFEMMWKALVIAQSKTGRDSVLARNRRNDLDTNMKMMTREQKDVDLLRRLEQHLSKSNVDLAAIKAACQSRDRNKAGKIPANEVVQIFVENNLPVYGALLKSLLNRCDDEQNNLISWPEAMSFLEKAKNYQADQWRPPTAASIASQPQSARAGAMSQTSLRSSSRQGRGRGRQGPGRTDSRGRTTPSRGRGRKNKGNDSADEETPGKANEENVAPEADALNKLASVATIQENGPEKPKDVLAKLRKNAESVRKNARLMSSIRGQLETTLPAEDKAKANVVQIKGKKVTLYTPDKFEASKVSTDPPQQRLKLEWVYGYRGNDTRNNLFLLTTGELAYIIGTTAVLYNKEDHSQRHYREHTQEIKCIAVHPNGVLIATGQGSNSQTKGHNKGEVQVRIWRADSLQTLNVIGENVFVNTVVAVSFSKSKDRVCAVDGSEGHILFVFDVHSGKTIVQAPLKTDVILDCDFNSVNADIIVTIGKEHLAWWCIMQEQGAVQMQYKADYGTYLKPKHVVSLLHNEKGDVITGDSNGTVYVWANGGNTITNFIKHGHDGPVFGLVLTRGTLITGGRDGRVCAWLWGKNMDRAGEIQLPPQEGGVRMLQLYKDMILIGTTTNSIRSVKMSAQALKNPLVGVKLDPVPLTQGHFDTVDSLASVQGGETGCWVITAGIDGILSLIDAKNKQPLWKLLIKNTRIYSVDVDDEASMVVLGTKDSVVVMDIAVEPGQGLFATETLRENLGKLITCVKFNPDFSVIAAGDQEGNIHILTWQEAEENEEEDQDGSWKVTGTCQGHKGRVNALDWSLDLVGDKYILRSSSDATELMYWDCESCRQLDKHSLYRNLKWRTSHSLLDFSVSGIWHSKRAKEAEVTSVDVNSQKTLVAMGDNAGYISLFRYPCSRQGAYSHTYKSHLSFRNLAFTKNGFKVMTAGGADSSILQWTVV